MPTQLQLNIQETISQIVHLERVEEQLKVTNRELELSYKEQKRLDKKLRKELREIEQLEGLSTKAIFHKILGSKEKQLEKERQDYLELSLKYEDLQKSIELLEYERNLLSAKTGTKEKTLKMLEELKLQREQEIIRLDPTLRNQLLTLSNEIEQAFAFKSEVEEALEVGTVCLNLTLQIIGHLTKVRNWGQWRGRNRTPMRNMMRRDAIDRARNLSYQVKHHLSLFEKELRDIGKHLSYAADTSKFFQFSDFFFNNLITDWIVNQQLTNAIGAGTSLRNQLKLILDELNQEKEKIINTVNDLSKKRDDILIA